MVETLREGLRVGFLVTGRCPRWGLPRSACSLARILLCQVTQLRCAAHRRPNSNGVNWPWTKISNTQRMLVFPSWFYQIFCYSESNALTQGQDVNNVSKTVTRLDWIHPNCPSASLATSHPQGSPFQFFLEPNKVNAAGCKANWSVLWSRACAQLHWDHGLSHTQKREFRSRFLTLQLLLLPSPSSLNFPKPWAISSNQLKTEIGLCFWQKVDFLTCSPSVLETIFAKMV